MRYSSPSASRARCLSVTLRLSVEPESVLVGLRVVEMDTPFVANDDMECIRCWYRAACRFVSRFKGTMCLLSHSSVSPTWSRSPLGQPCLGRPAAPASFGPLDKTHDSILDKDIHVYLVSSRLREWFRKRTCMTTGYLCLDPTIDSVTLKVHIGSLGGNHPSCLRLSPGLFHLQS
jgi:hypothetical protein